MVKKFATENPTKASNVVEMVERARSSGARVPAQVNGISQLIQQFINTPAIANVAEGASPAVLRESQESAYKNAARGIPGGGRFKLDDAAIPAMEKFISGEATTEQIDAAKRYADSRRGRQRTGSEGTALIRDIMDILRTELHPDNDRIYSRTVSGTAKSATEPPVKAARPVRPESKPVKPETRESRAQRQNNISGAASKNREGSAATVVKLIERKGPDGALSWAIENLRNATENSTGRAGKAEVEKLTKMVDRIHLVNGLVDGSIDPRATGIAEPAQIIEAKKIIAGNADLAGQYLGNRFPEAKVNEVMRGLQQAIEQGGPNVTSESYELLRRAEINLEREGTQSVAAGNMFRVPNTNTEVPEGTPGAWSSEEQGVFMPTPAQRRQMMMEDTGKIAPAVLAEETAGRGARTSTNRLEDPEPDYINPVTGRRVITAGSTIENAGRAAEGAPPESVEYVGSDTRRFPPGWADRLIYRGDAPESGSGLAGGLQSVRNLSKGSSPEVIARGRARLAEGRKILAAEEAERAEAAAARANRPVKTAHERMVNALVSNISASRLGLEDGASPQAKRAVIEGFMTPAQEGAARVNNQVTDVVNQLLGAAAKNNGVESINELDPNTRLSVYKEIWSGLKKFVSEVGEKTRRNPGAERIDKAQIADAKKQIRILQEQIAEERQNYSTVRNLAKSGQIPQGIPADVPAIAESGDKVSRPTGATAELSEISNRGAGMQTEMQRLQSLLGRIESDRGPEFVEKVGEDYAAPNKTKSSRNRNKRKKK